MGYTIEIRKYLLLSITLLRVDVVSLDGSSQQPDDEDRYDTEEIIVCEAPLEDEDRRGWLQGGYVGEEKARIWCGEGASPFSTDATDLGIFRSRPVATPVRPAFRSVTGRDCKRLYLSANHISSVCTHSHLVSYLHICSHILLANTV